MDLEWSVKDYACPVCGQLFQVSNDMLDPVIPFNLLFVTTGVYIHMIQ